VGASSAIEIARRVGLPEDVCARAREILGGGASAVSQAVERLEKERAEAARARAELAAAREELERERGALQRERERLRELERQTRAGARSELIDDLQKKRAEVSALIAQLQAAPAMAQAVEVQRAIEGAAAAEQREQARGEEPEALAEAALAPGARVKHLRLGTEGVELELDRATRAGEERVHVLHGHGSGALKAAVREHLQHSPYVGRARPGEQHEGGDGMTVVELA